MKRMGSVALECFLDLGVTIAYATLAGLLIAAIIASDDGLRSLWTALAWTSLLPAVTALFIGVDVLIRVAVERRVASRGASRPVRPLEATRAGQG